MLWLVSTTLAQFLVLSTISPHTHTQFKHGWTTKRGITPRLLFSLDQLGTNTLTHKQIKCPHLLVGQYVQERVPLR